MKIFMGLSNIASLMKDYEEGFTALGHECFCVSNHNVGIVDGPIDMSVPELVEAMLRKGNDFSPEARSRAHEKILNMAWQKALEADVCFFFWNSFKPNASDLAVLKKMGKRIVVRFCGSEVRDPHVEAQYAVRYNTEAQQYGLPEDLSSLRHKLCYLRQVERYADMIINGSNMSLRPYHWREACIFSQQGIVRRTEPQRKIPIILHAPSNRKTKGTQVWLNVFEALRTAGLQFGVKIIENIPHKDMLREYTTADIVCGSLYYGGRAMWEAFSAGCVHVGVGSTEMTEGALENFKKHFEPLGLTADTKNIMRKMEICDHYAPGFGSPNVNVTEQNVAQALADLILDLPRRQVLADAGPKFMDRWFSPQRVCQNLIDKLFSEDSLEKQLELHLPTFFRDHYIPPKNDMERLRLFNSYNKMVSRCDWYKTYVPSAERDGLVF